MSMVNYTLYTRFKANRLANIPRSNLGGLDGEGQPLTPEAKTTIRKKYRDELAKHVYICLLTSKLLLWSNPHNSRIGTDSAGFDKVEPRCGYENPDENLMQIFGEEDAIKLVQGLPLRWLTPAYDVVGMICADAALEEGSDVGCGLGLSLQPADPSSYEAILTKEQVNASSFPVLQTMPTSSRSVDGIYARGPFS